MVTVRGGWTIWASTRIVCSSRLPMFHRCHLVGHQQAQQAVDLVVDVAQRTRLEPSPWTGSGSLRNAALKNGGTARPSSTRILGPNLC